MLELEAYAGRRILITGHTGFKGSWLANTLIGAGAQVLGFALDPAYKNSHFDLLNLHKRMKSVIGDIRDLQHLEATFHDFQPEFVFHLAAQALVKTSYLNPHETFETNLMGSVNLLEAVRNSESVKSLVFITSDKAYENVEWLWGYRENDRLGGRDPYSASKGAAELVFSSYLRSYFADRNDFGAASTRAGNVIGGGDWAADRIIPDAIRAVMHNEALVLRSPRATRPWQHVLEPISGYLTLGLALEREPTSFSGSWNFGPNVNQVRTVADVAQRLYDRIGLGSIVVDKSHSVHHEANLLQLNCEKANQMLDWSAKWSADEAVDRTASWFAAFLSGEDVVSVTNKQIEDYFGERS